MDREQGTGSRNCEMGGGKQVIENKEPMEHKTGNCGEQGAGNKELRTGGDQETSYYRELDHGRESLWLVYRVL